MAEEYSFLDESGDNMVIDLAVTSTSGSQGSIHTVDVTEPYNPRVLGVVKDSSGNVVNNILAKVKLTGVTPTITKVKPSGGAACEESAIFDGTCRATFTEGVAKFYVKNEPGLDPAQNPYVTLNFEIDFSGYAWWQNLLNMSPLNMLTKKATVRLRVRNNSNVTFGEVLNGEAVFVGDVDAKGKGGSIGLSDRNLNPAIEKFFEQ